MHDLQLLQDVAIINARVRRELGPMPRRNAFTSSHQERSSEVEKMSAHKIATLAFAVGASVPSMGSAVQLTEDVSAIPEKVRALAGADKALLAYKWVLNDMGGKTMAVVLRSPKEPAPEVPIDELPSYTCELILLHEDREGHGLITGRTNKAVNCKDNDFNRKADEFDLNDRLTLGHDEVTYRNDFHRLGSYSYSFAFASGRWHLSWANSIYTESGEGDEGVLVFEEKVTYPATIPFVSMEDFEPDNLTDALSKNRSLIP